MPGWMALTGMARVGLSDNVRGEGADGCDTGRIGRVEERHG